MYYDALRIIAQDTEVFTSGNSEYERGQLELVADLFGRPGIERGVRVEEVRTDVKELDAIENPYEPGEDEEQDPPASARASSAPDVRYVLSFEPDAIRQHFEGDEDSLSAYVEVVEDSTLREIAEECLSSDILYKAFHDVLVLAVEGRLTS